MPANAVSAVPLNGLLALKVAIASVAFGLTSVLFAEATHGLQWVFKRVIPWPYIRPVVGGCIVIALVALVGTRDYLGLGTVAPPTDPTAVTIQSCFTAGGATAWSWWWKILFTAVTLGSGFKGGEVTPLFFVGAALGNTLAGLLGAPVDLFAGLGFVGRLRRRDEHSLGVHHYGARTVSAGQQRSGRFRLWNLFGDRVFSGLLVQRSFRNLPVTTNWNAEG